MLLFILWLLLLSRTLNMELTVKITTTLTSSGFPELILEPRISSVNS